MSSRANTGLSVTSLSDALYHAMRVEIFEGRIGAGDVVTEVGIAERFGVARPTAKVAVDRLVHDGLLRRSQNKSAVVPTLGLTDARELYKTRLLLEGQIFREVAEQRHISPVAQRHIRDLEDQVRSPVLSAVVEADVGFHRAVVAQLGNSRLTRLHDAIMGEMHLCMAQVQRHMAPHPEKTAADHRSMVEAILDGDQDRVVAELTAHLASAQERLVAYLEEDETGEQTSVA